MKRIDKLDNHLNLIHRLALDTSADNFARRVAQINVHVTEARKLVARIKTQATAFRSSVSGHYITPAAAKANPHETLKEGAK